MTARFRPSLALVGWLILPGLTLAAPDDTGKNASKNQRVEGVIIKAEPVDSDNGHCLRLTINTAAVWRDYARDSALNDTRKDSTKKAAKRGDDSVATEGQPRDRDTLVTIDVAADTPAHKRFRAEKDEATLGASSAKAALKAAENPTDDSPPQRAAPRSSPTTFARASTSPSATRRPTNPTMPTGSSSSSPSVTTTPANDQ